MGLRVRPIAPTLGDHKPHGSEPGFAITVPWRLVRQIRPVSTEEFIQWIPYLHSFYIPVMQTASQKHQRVSNKSSISVQERFQNLQTAAPYSTHNFIHFMFTVCAEEDMCNRKMWRTRWRSTTRIPGFLAEQHSTILLSDGTQEGPLRSHWHWTTRRNSLLST